MSLALNVIFKSSYPLKQVDNTLETGGNVVLDDQNGNKNLSYMKIVFNLDEFDNDKLQSLIKNGETKLCTGNVINEDNQYVFKIEKIGNNDKSLVSDIEADEYVVRYSKDNDSISSNLVKMEIEQPSGLLQVFANTDWFNNGSFNDKESLVQFLKGVDNTKVPVKYKLISSGSKVLVSLLSLGKSGSQDTKDTVVTVKKATTDNEVTDKKEINEVTNSKSEIDTLKEELAKKNKEIEELKRKVSSNGGLGQNKDDIQEILAISQGSLDAITVLQEQVIAMYNAFAQVKPVLEDLQERNEIEKERKNVEDLDAIEQYYFNLSPEAILSDKVDRLLDDKRDHSVPYQRIIDEAIARRKTIFDKPDDENKPKVVKKTDRVVIERNDVE